MSDDSDSDDDRYQQPPLSDANRHYIAPPVPSLAGQGGGATSQADADNYLALQQQQAADYGLSPMSQEDMDEVSQDPAYLLYFAQQDYALANSDAQELSDAEDEDDDHRIYQNEVANQQVDGALANPGHAPSHYTDLPPVTYPLWFDYVMPRYVATERDRELEIDARLQRYRAWVLAHQPYSQALQDEARDSLLLFGIAPRAPPQNGWAAQPNTPTITPPTAPPAPPLIPAELGRDHPIQDHQAEPLEPSQLADPTPLWRQWLAQNPDANYDQASHANQMLVRYGIVPQNGWASARGTPTIIDTGSQPSSSGSLAYQDEYDYAAARRLRAQGLPMPPPMVPDDDEDDADEDADEDMDDQQEGSPVEAAQEDDSQDVAQVQQGPSPDPTASRASLHQPPVPTLAATLAHMQARQSQPPLAYLQDWLAYLFNTHG
jgi:hypothetical protein